MIFRLILTFTLLFISLNLTFGQTTDTSVSNNLFDSEHIEKIDSSIVYVSFKVQKNGKITNVEVIEIKCQNCDKKLRKDLQSEAIRIIKSMPDWQPNSVSVTYVQPLRFNLINK
jgi:hypothetical protein